MAETVTYEQALESSSSTAPADLLEAAVDLLLVDDSRLPQYAAERRRALLLYALSYYAWAEGRSHNRPRTETFSVDEGQASGLRALADEIDKRDRSSR